MVTNKKNSFSAAIFAILAIVNGVAANQAGADANRFEHILRLKPRSTITTQAQTFRDLIERLLPKQASLFEIVIDSNFTHADYLDKFKIEPNENGTIRIVGNTGVSAANGFYYYLKNIANCSTSWSGDQLDLLQQFSFTSNRLPQPPHAIEVIIRDKLRYYQNVCTASYSMVWWRWPRWEREIDWMAMRGINLPLAFVAQEAIFRRVFSQNPHLFNLTSAQVEEYFTGPAFLAWNRMGNMQTWTGPLSEHWHKSQIQLQTRILDRMRNFGMIPVVPGFAGHVPRALRKVAPNASIETLTDWNHFGRNYSYTSFLQPEDPNFAAINREFILEYIHQFDSDHIYNIDLFNEETPPRSDPAYLQRCGSSVYNSIIAADPNAIWLMQGWLFVYQPQFWRPAQVKAFVSSVPTGRLLILDLFSEIAPGYSRFDGYYGQPFLWCMLHNFGGVSGLYGALNRVNGENSTKTGVDGIFAARTRYHNMLGVGLTMEGIEQNDIAYEYMTETSWRDRAPSDMAQWFSSYVQRRYGRQDTFLDEAWQALRTSVYQDPIGLHNHGVYAINRRPGLSKPRSTLWYDPRAVSSALRAIGKFLDLHQNETQILERSETLRHDTVDIARQTLQLIFDYYREKKLFGAYVRRDIPELRNVARDLLRILDLFEAVLRCGEHFLLHNWIEAARAIGEDESERDFNEEQARNQVTIWGPDGNIVDYAAKHWSGLASDYYRPRWALFLDALTSSLERNVTFDEKKFKRDVFQQIELPFTRRRNQSLVQQPDNAQNLVRLTHQIVAEAAKTIDRNTDSDQSPAYYYNEEDIFN